MIRIIVVIVIIVLVAPVHAGFRMWGPNGYIEDTESPQDKANRQTSEQQLKQQRDALEAAAKEEQDRIQEHNARMQSGFGRSLSSGRPSQDNFDLSGVEWRQSRGYYSGRASQETTRKYGYRAGKYRIEYRYKAHRHFAIWLHSRRGLQELLVNRIGKANTSRTITLSQDDEVWFEVHSPFGNWEFTFERVGC